MGYAMKGVQGQLVLPSLSHVSPIMSFMDCHRQHVQRVEHGVIPYQYALVITYQL